MTAHHRHPPTDVWTAPYASIVAALRDAQIADGRCEFEDQLSAVEDALAQLVVLRNEVSGAIETAHLRPANYSLGGPEK
jgi:hypothetical protein